MILAIDELDEGASAEEEEAEEETKEELESVLGLSLTNLDEEARTELEIDAEIEGCVDY